jgi:acyl carrier protein/NADP-dependent 3-hydroxy acid dehydrogenase YdfG
MDLDLEADLGIDTVKQAEVFAAIRETYGIERDDALKLRDYPTLNHVVGFVHDHTGAPAGAPAATAPAAAAAPAPVEPAAPAPPAPAAAAPTPEPAAAPAAAPAPAAVSAAPAAGEVEARVLALVAEQTGYPEDLLDMDLDLEADLGIDTVKQAEVFAAIRETYGIERDDALKLRDYPTLNHVVGFVHDHTGAPAEQPAATAPAAPVAPAPVEPAPSASFPTPAAPAAAAAAPAAVAAGSSAPAAGEVEARVLALVAEQTGYPEDLLDMDLDLEADLGIDTVKQAEVFAAIRETYGIERDDALKLRDYPTLNHVVGFVHDHTGAPAGAQPAPTAATPAAPAAPAPAPPAPPAPTPHVSTAAPLEAADAEGFPRRLPAPVLRPPLEFCAATGVAIGQGSRVVLMPDAGGVGAALSTLLNELGAEVLTIDGAPDVEALEQQISGWTAAGPIQGVYWLPALDDEGPLSGLDAAGRVRALHVRVKLLAATMRALGEQIGAAGTFLVSATRLGGRHGYDAAGAASVLGGAVTGFTKALSREHPDAGVKAVDFGAGGDPAATARTLLEETLHDPGAVEVGYADELRWSVGLIERPAVHDPAREPGPDTVFAVTGAAGSIVSAIVTDLAAASGGTFHLLDLVPAPDPADPDVARFESDRDGLARELADRMRAQGERPTPKLVERELARIERARAALDGIAAIERAGGKAYWHQVNLTDAAQVSAAIASALATSGRIDVMLHCAGIEISHFLADKPQREYDLVFDVKAHGWLNLLAAFGEAGVEAPGCAIVFSSIAGRFGNGGQTDYSAANDLLCKSISHLRRSGGTRGIAIDWTAWAGIGMATRGSIPKVMAAAGIDMLPPEVGVPVVHRELAAGGAGREVLVAGTLGMMLEERHATGGLDAERATAALGDRGGPMTGRITGLTSGGTLSVLTELDPSRQAFLNDHRIDGTPVLPAVMGMEGFAEIARALVPGWKVVALEDVELRAPFKFYRDEPRAVILQALLHDGDDGTLLADCELIGRRALRGQDEQETHHFSGRARLAREAPAEPPLAVSPAGADTGEGGVGHDAVYGVYFHGPAYQVLDRAWREDGHFVGSFAGELPADHEPASQPTEFAPRLIELCFQTAGLWEIGIVGKMALPMHIDRVVCFTAADAPGRLWAIVNPRDGGVDAEVVDDTGRVRVRLEGYRTIEMPGALEAEALARLRTAIGSEETAS